MTTRLLRTTAADGIDRRWFADLPAGGHVAAPEQPESPVEQVRGFFRLVR